MGTVLRIIDVILIVFLTAAGGDTLLSLKKNRNIEVEEVRPWLTKRLNAIMILTILTAVVTVAMILIK